MILLKNGTFIDWQTLEFRQADILVEEGSDGNLVFDSLPGSAVPEKVIDCADKFITRSFANGHHHVYSALSRGMNPPRKNTESFFEILEYIWWNLDKSLDLEMIHSSALVTAIACAKNGVTFVIDHHASPFAVEGSLETIASAFDEAGLGHLLCYEISDRDGIEIAGKGLSETEGYLARRQGLVGLHASFTVGDDTLKRAVDLATRSNSGIHIHIAEDLSDEAHCLEHYGMRIIPRMDEAGVLRFPKTILAHCLHLDENERKLMARSPAWIVQNTESNLNNRVGHFSSAGLGANIMFGTDGMHSDMLRSAKAAFFAGQEYDAIDYAETYRRFRNVHHYLNQNGFRGDEENNLVILDYDTPTPFTGKNFLGHFLFGIGSRHVRHVISGGKLIVENGKMLTLNEPEILAEAQVQAARLWARMR